MSDLPTSDEVATLIRDRDELLMADVAVHFLIDPDETRDLVEPLIADGLVERVWRPMSNDLRQLCDCDREEVFRWVGTDE